MLSKDISGKQKTKQTQNKRRKHWLKGDELERSLAV